MSEFSKYPHAPLQDRETLPYCKFCLRPYDRAMDNGKETCDARESIMNGRVATSLTAPTLRDRVKPEDSDDVFFALRTDVVEAISYMLVSLNECDIEGGLKDAVCALTCLRAMRSLQESFPDKGNEEDG